MNCLHLKSSKFSALFLHCIFFLTITFLVQLFPQNTFAQNLMNLGESPHFSGLSDQNQTVTDTDFDSNVRIVNFFFTSCKGPCPALMRVVQSLTENVNCTNARFISFSVDPEIDTPNALAQYRKDAGFDDPRWSLVTVVDASTVESLLKGYKLGSGELPAAHTTRLVLVDKKGQIRALPRSDQVSEIKRMISTLCEGS